MKKKVLAGKIHRKMQFMGTTSLVLKTIKRADKKASCPKACGDEEGEAVKWFLWRAGGFCLGLGLSLCRCAGFLS